MKVREDMSVGMTETEIENLREICLDKEEIATVIWYVYKCKSM
jgi:hypothetical protein